MLFLNKFEKCDLHVHSRYSDGTSTPEEIVEKAIDYGLEAVAVVDHVRRSTGWLDSFAREMERLKVKYEGRIFVFSGIEAKVINLLGDLDVRPDFASKVDMVLAAFHRLPSGQETYLSTEEIAINKPAALAYWYLGLMAVLENSDVDIVAHPNAILVRYGIEVPRMLKEGIARKAAAREIAMEINTRYDVPDEEFISLLREYKALLSYGSDSHSLEELDRAWNKAGVPC